MPDTRVAEAPVPAVRSTPQANRVCRLAWAAVLILVAVAALGLVMFTRWVPVHRQNAERVSHRAAAAGAVGAQATDGRPAALPADSLPAEHSFPLVVVVLHGVCAAATVSLVLLVALGVIG